MEGVQGADRLNSQPFLDIWGTSTGGHGSSKSKF
jgi:hypothetical protein